MNKNVTMEVMPLFVVPTSHPSDISHLRWSSSPYSEAMAATISSRLGAPAVRIAGFCSSNRTAGSRARLTDSSSFFGCTKVQPCQTTFAGSFCSYPLRIRQQRSIARHARILAIRSDASDAQKTTSSNDSGELLVCYR